MVTRLYALGFALASAGLGTVAAAGQDMAVRVEAIRLLERANAVSRPAQQMPIHREEVTFKAYGLDGSTKEGRADSLHDGDIERFETIFGSYHAVSIHYPDKIVQNDYEPTPPEVQELDHLIPLLLGRFDKSDTIHQIRPATVAGRPAKCIEFETLNGRTRESNEICVDEQRGTLVRWNVGDELVEDTDYVEFEGVWLPTHIRHFINGRLRMEVEQKFTVVKGPIDWAALTPPNSSTLTACQEYRRPFVQSNPQPAAAGPGPWYDVHVNGVIQADGRVSEASVFPKGRPDLEKQAVQIVSTWVFTPALCNGKAIPVEAHLVVHFPPN